MNTPNTHFSPDHRLNDERWFILRASICACWRLGSGSFRRAASVFALASLASFSQAASDSLNSKPAITDKGNGDALFNMWLDPTESDPTVEVRSEATYSVTFQGSWTTAVTPGGVQLGAHFTTLIGGVHNAGVTFLREGGRASAGVELMAELGGTSILAGEVRAARPNALAVLLGSGDIRPTGSSTIDRVTVTTDHPRVTLLTMIAPSPDWFVGVSGLSLLDAQGEWPASLAVNLYPWDAGTEEGTEFSLSNPDTSPQGVITSLRGMGKFSNEPIATLTFTRQSVETDESAPPELLVSTLVSGLSIPWDLAFTPDGTMLFTEKRGVLSSRRANGTVRNVDAEFGDLFAVGETGLMGIVVDPDFASNRRFYTCQGHLGPEVQVIGWTIDADYTAATRVADPLVGGIPATSGRHGGCRLRFGPEGYLWIGTGDAASGRIPQDLTSLGGKVLRVDPFTGAGAPTNPLAPSRVYTYGHRNVQGLALRAGTSQMWSVEHGPQRDDEINLLEAGGNYGWDPVPGYNESVPMTDLAKYPDAVEARWSSGSPTLAVSGGIFLEGSHW
ncbi:MAG: PQQ-dependent sugar dehydrogenase, partial [Candidatus Aminicenantes bacterium]|nr:PQQ-dependent sugar dehydrogenase [Candidatus Aminicenantes bacterium]